MERAKINTLEKGNLQGVANLKRRGKNVSIKTEIYHSIPIDSLHHCDINHFHSHLDHSAIHPDIREGLCPEHIWDQGQCCGSLHKKCHQDH